ncbi:conserved hypothetical protein [Theileria orientalis strain Shintoku]|uniref:Uncharacterized protein n=1 Tax=Theileria orientalis strain Shintoku TaxID=869250 RepID=J7MC41_THEOR|nr:conserved hypothetical protein [Theileria orientalis strain Shintoku]PVC52294.1 hypothetical protein MACL_00000897 [Theileria orientalis]BAM38782.1 conserved hypothetical protein [Theileria orientalis strain Shintoku]|eukprot:XP_009689083.1 conserved hypothetical protein [Theileria orientalis strain Shintoku]
MSLLNVLLHKPGLKRTIMSNIGIGKHLLGQTAVESKNVLISPENSYFYRVNSDQGSVQGPSSREIITPIIPKIVNLPEFINNVEYNNPVNDHKIITRIGNTNEEYVDQVTHEKYLFNKLRNDTKHRKRAFVKRGYFRRTRCLERKLNRLSYAYALQGIDYEMLESLEMGELPDLKDFKK